jgi:hypothetical protein
MDDAAQAMQYARCKKSGWTIAIRHLSDYNFARLNHDIAGVPIYVNNGQFWPRPCEGIEVVVLPATASKGT